MQVTPPEASDIAKIYRDKKFETFESNGICCEGHVYTCRQWPKVESPSVVVEGILEGHGGVRLVGQCHCPLSRGL